ncbi:MAG: phosphate/phosphonate ABC transporter permease [Lautropia sp.]|nr:phosphate/phosphonate ABC transporter permease [Lautropia sp.]
MTPIPPRPPVRLSMWLLALATLALIVASFRSLDLQWAELLTPAALDTMIEFIGSFFPPAHDGAFLTKTLRAALETLAMSLLGTLLALVFGLLLALPASLHTHQAAAPFAPAQSSAENTLPPSCSGSAHLQPHPAGRNSATGIGTPVIHGTARLLLNVLRAVPELVWAVLLLVSAGLGPMAGTLALALHTTGVLGRLFAESIENAPPEPADALRQRGIGPARTLLWATLPQIAPQLLSYTLYRWENNIRAATILGVVGAGGLGQMLSFHLGLFHMPETSTVLIAMILLVSLVDALSFAARRALR